MYSTTLDHNDIAPSVSFEMVEYFKLNMSNPGELLIWVADAELYLAQYRLLFGNEELEYVQSLLYHLKASTIPSLISKDFDLPKEISNLMTHRGSSLSSRKLLKSSIAINKTRWRSIPYFNKE